MGKLDGKVAVITGGASGIGEGAVRLFVQEGARVIFGDLQADKGARLSAELDENASFLRADVTQAEQVKALVDLAIEKYGRLDCIFNNAGVPGPVSGLLDNEISDFDHTVAVMLRGVFLGMKYAAQVMVEQRSGSIISTASVAGIEGGHAGHIYTAVKHGVIGLTRSVALELGEHNVRVNAICPGGIATPIFARGFGMEISAADATVDKVKQVLQTVQAIPRAGVPDDIAKAAVWLASDDSTFVNGHALVVDGGLTAGNGRWSKMQELGIQLLMNFSS